MNRPLKHVSVPAVLLSKSAVIAVAAVFFLLFGSPESRASGEPQASPLYQNFVTANEVFAQALVAHGGQDLIDRKVSFRVAIEGHYLAEGHYQSPWAVHDYVVQANQIYSAPLQAIRQHSHYNYNRPLEGVIILDATSGIEREAGSSETQPVDAEELAESWNDQFMTFPHEWLRQVQANRASLRSFGQTDAHDIVGFTDENGKNFALYFDRQSHLLHRIENIGHWKIKGDRLEWREFTNYQEIGGYLIALDYTNHVERYASQHGVVQHIASVEFGIDIDPAEFVMPEKFVGGVEDWKVTPPEPVVAEEPLLPVTDLGRGLYIVDLPDCDSRSLLVEFDDFAVIVEAGDHSGISSRLLATADHLLPEKPVRYVGMTHHHPLYSGGLRPYAQRGVTILTTAGNADFYRELTTRPYRIAPDAQQMSSREPVIQIIDKKLIIEDGNQRVEFHAFDPGTHVEEFVLPYVPSHKLVITGDFIKFDVEKKEPRLARKRTQALYDIIQERSLEVETIVQTWYLTDGRQLGSMAEIEDSVRLADEEMAGEVSERKN